MAIEDDELAEVLAEHPLGLAGQVYDSMVDLILSGQLQPLQPLRIHSLAKSLGVSATPVREALVRASASGLVVRENNKGFRVSPRPGATQLDDLFEARLTIEEKTARLAASHVDGELLTRLEATWLAQQARSGDDTFEGFRGFLDADHDFHAHIARASGNHYLASALETMGSHVQRFRSFRRGRREPSRRPKADRYRGSPREPDKPDLGRKIRRSRVATCRLASPPRC